MSIRGFGEEELARSLDQWLYERWRENIEAQIMVLKALNQSGLSFDDLKKHAKQENPDA